MKLRRTKNVPLFGPPCIGFRRTWSRALCVDQRKLTLGFYIGVPRTFAGRVLIYAKFGHAEYSVHSVSI